MLTSSTSSLSGRWSNVSESSKTMWQVEHAHTPSHAPEPAYIYVHVSATHTVHYSNTKQTHSYNIPHHATPHHTTHTQTLSVMQPTSLDSSRIESFSLTLQVNVFKTGSLEEIHAHFGSRRFDFSVLVFPVDSDTSQLMATYKWM